MFSPSPSTMQYSSLYGGTGGSAAVMPPASQVASGGAVPMQGGDGSAHVAWLGIVVALILIRILYEAGARVE
jgi:hypothetical protein